MSNLLALRTDMRLRLRDTDTANTRYTDAHYNSWINRGIQRIARETLILQSTGSIDGDDNASYTLIGAGANALAADYYLMQGVDVDNNGVAGFAPPKYSQLRQVNIEEIQRLIVAASGTLPINVVPKKYAIWGGKIYLETRIPTDGNINCRYYKTPTVLSGNTDTPDTPLDSWDGLVLAAASLDYAYDEGNRDDDGRQKRIKDFLAVYDYEKTVFLQLYPLGMFGGLTSEVVR